MSKPNPGGARPSDARAVALDLLSAVLDRGTPLDSALADTADLATLAPRDRAFARLLVTTVLRRLGQIDAAIADKLERPLAKRHQAARHILRLGVAQLGFLDTPAHAAVDASVTLARRRGLAGLAGLINAILRAIDRAGAKELVAASERVARNAPDWLRDSWRAAYGAEVTTAIMAAHIGEPPLDFTLAPGASAADWAARLDAEVLPTGSLRRRGGGRVDQLPGYGDAAWWVQDAAAALPARLLGDVAGRSIIDLCAAPGGKTAQLAAAGATVTAVDVAPARLELLRANLARLKLDAEIVCADATNYVPARTADAVLLDAPCTATGTIRRHPDIAWLKRPGDVAAAASLQARLLRAAVAMLAPGGTLVYAVCSLQPEEGPAQIDALLAESDTVIRRPVAADELPGLAGLAPPAITPAGDVRTLPCHFAAAGGIDGFYIARLRRR